MRGWQSTALGAAAVVLSNLNVDPLGSRRVSAASRGFH
jgi:hypothetical protein